MGVWAAARGWVERPTGAKTTPGTRHQAPGTCSTQPRTSSETTFRSVREPVLGLSDSRAIDGAVDGGAGDVEQLGEFGGGVSSCLVELNEVGFLGGAEFGLLAA